ncbi:MAG: hypothetical protein H5T80_08750, partial [Dietzia sp.]|nr:hypothetical protein [Dietzia sp.]
VQGDDRIVLGTADASENGGISVDVTVPASATPGVALIELGLWAEPIEVEVR